MSFAKGTCAFLFVAAVDKIKHNKSNYKNNKNRDNDPYPNGNSACGGFSFADLDLNKKDRRKGSYINGSGNSVCVRNKLYFNDGVCVCLISKGRKSGNVADNKAVGSVLINKLYICNGAAEIGARGIKIGVFAVSHIIIAVIIADVDGMYHGENIAAIIGFGACLGSVKGIGNSTVKRTGIGKSVYEKGKVECRKGISVCNKCGRGGIGYAVTVKSRNLELGIFTDVLVDEKLNFGYGNIAGNAESKADGLKNINCGRSFNNGRGAAAGFNLGNRRRTARAA